MGNGGLPSAVQPIDTDAGPRSRRSVMQFLSLERRRLLSNLNLNPKLASLLACGALLLPTSAYAHIDMLEPLLSRGGDQKQSPCEGKAWGAGPVYTFEPGATVTLKLRESVSHDGYFRVSFARNESDLKDPVSIDPVNPDRYGPGQKCAKDNPNDNCGQSDFCKFVSTDGGSTVLWDKLDPHIPSGLLNGKEWTWNVKLPDVECEQCTIQVLQVMEDAQVLVGALPVETHGPFDGNNDLYWRCIDVKLKRGAGESVGVTTAPAQNNGIDCVAQASNGEAPGEGGDDVVVVVPDAPDAGSEPGAGDGDHDHEPGHDGPPLTGENPPNGTPGGNGTAPLSSASSDGCSVSHVRAGSSTLGLLGVLVALGLVLHGLRRKKRS